MRVRQLGKCYIFKIFSDTLNTTTIIASSARAYDGADDARAAADGADDMELDIGVVKVVGRVEGDASRGAESGGG